MNNLINQPISAPMSIRMSSPITGFQRTHLRKIHSFYENAPQNVTKKRVRIGGENAFIYPSFQVLNMLKFFIILAFCKTKIITTLKLQRITGTFPSSLC